MFSIFNISQVCVTDEAEFLRAGLQDRLSGLGKKQSEDI
jgi:hypothetical protein